jgi:ribosomal protein L7Ae-like RNA K-turn-binding protein
MIKNNNKKNEELNLIKKIKQNVEGKNKKVRLRKGYKKVIKRMRTKLDNK